VLHANFVARANDYENQNERLEKNFKTKKIIKKKFYGRILRGFLGFNVSNKKFEGVLDLSFV
jgi:hypothetical protein